MPSEATKAKALDALEGMRGIVRREMVKAGAYYVEDEISNPKLARAICGGRKHCAIGSLWAGAGVKTTLISGVIDLPGVREEERRDFLRRRPALRLALDSLNAAASAFAEKHGMAIGVWDDAIEGVFEGHYGDDLTKRDLLNIIAAAKRRINKG